MRLPGPDALCWIDGHALALEQARLRVDDPALVAGLGLFETLSVRGGRPLDLEPHLRRLLEGARDLDLPAPDTGRLREQITAAAAALGAGRGWIRLTLTGGGRVVVLAERIADPTAEPRGACAISLPWRRNPRDPLTAHKTLSRAANAVALRWARARGADEGLWQNVRGHVAEGCTSNVFVVRDRKLHTPGLREAILPGVVRSIVLRVARDLGLAVHEGRLRPARLRRAHEVFLTSSLRGVWPMIRLDGRPVGGGRTGVWTGRIAEEVERRRLAAAAEATLDGRRPERDLELQEADRWPPGEDDAR